MHHILVMGAGKIGSLIAFLLAKSQKYQVFLADVRDDYLYQQHLQQFKNFQYIKLDAKDEKNISAFVQSQKIIAIVSCLPFYCNIALAKVAAANHLHYFDLTEDVETTDAVQKIAANLKQAFVPQCGLAPGFINIIANHLMQSFTEIDTVKLRVGALPQYSSNALQYALTWSTEGLINEYGNLCRAVIDGKEMNVLPLEGLEEIEIDGALYEAFNTSGGIASLADTYANKLKNLNYKTMRYPGHCEKMKFLMDDLQLNTDRKTLKHILERAIPTTLDDMVIVYSAVTGKDKHIFTEKNYVKKFYPKEINGIRFSAIQLTTASSLCCVLDLVLNNASHFQGYIRQEQFSFTDFAKNEFGKYYIEA